jgi:hypothetical protein
MDEHAITDLAEHLAAFAEAVANADDAERRRLLASLYRALQAAGLSESVAAAVQHQLGRTTDATTTQVATVAGSARSKGDVTHDR